MRMLYIANIRLPTEKAHGAQIMKMCEAFAALGHEITLFVTDRNTDIREDPFAYYDVRPHFSIVRAHVPDTVRFGPLGFLFETWMFARAAMRYARIGDADVIYGRDERVLSRLLTLGRPIVWETHTGAWNRAARALARGATRIVAISQGLKRFYVERGVPAEKVIVVHDGIDLGKFAVGVSKETARARLGLPLDKKVALYIGRLDGWKGSETLLEASRLLPPDILVAVIGGEDAQVAQRSAQYPGVRFLGARPYREIAGSTAAADILILPNTGKSEISAHFTSPLKLFAYMASSRPIIASDLPSIREVLSSEDAVFFRPDDERSLADGIAKSFENYEESLGRARRARGKVTEYEWTSRARAIEKALAYTEPLP